MEGYLKTRSWDDTAGVKRYKTEIVSDNVILLSSAGGGREESSYADAAPTEMSAPRKSKAKAEESISIEDIPF